MKNSEVDIECVECCCRFSFELQNSYWYFTMAHTHTHTHFARKYYSNYTTPSETRRIVVVIAVCIKCTHRKMKRTAAQCFVF